MNHELMSYFVRRFRQGVFTGLPLTILVLLFLIFLASFIGVTDAVVNSSPAAKLDLAFTNFIFTARTPQVASFFYGITTCANQLTVSILLGITIVYLLLKRELIYLYALLICFVGGEASSYFLKIFINRDRPGSNFAYYIESSKSFPSGHSVVAVVFFGFMTYYLIRHTSKKSMRTLIISLSSIFIGLIGFSRIYLGVHYLSDVLGGLLIGGLWLVTSITFREHHFYISSIKKARN